jgi:hypothetical protein
MTHAELATILFGNFSPEERTVPDSVTYPGRNAAVMAAINGAIQEAYTRSPVWVHHAEFGVVLHAPTAVTISCVENSTAATINQFEAWMEGCAIVIAGHDIDNRIMEATGGSFFASATVNPSGGDNSVLYTAISSGQSGNSITITYDAAAAQFTTTVNVSDLSITITPGTKARMIVTDTGGGLEDTNTDPVVFTDLSYAGNDGTYDFWSSNGEQTYPGVGNYYRAYGVTGFWTLDVWIGSSQVAEWSSTDPVADPSQVTTWNPVGGTGTPVVTAGTSSAQQVIDAINSDFAAAVLVSASASGTVTGEVASVGPVSLAGGDGGVSLLFPYAGDTGTVDATVYHTSISIPAAVMRILKPVIANLVELIPVANPHSHQSATFGDFASNPRQNLVPRNIRVGETKGKVTGYKTESHHVSNTATPTQRMRIVPAPAEAGFLTYQATMRPPFVTSLSATSVFPIPHEFVESILLPMALFRLSRAPFFRNQEAIPGLADGYRQALADLDALTPQEDNERRMRPIYG